MNLRKFISGVSALAIAASAFAGMAVTASAAETVGNVDNSSGWWSAFSKEIALTDGQEAKFNFTLKTTDTFSDWSKWHNWVTYVTSTPRGEADYTEYFAIRGDYSRWAPGVEQTADDIDCDYKEKTNEDLWRFFNGADVEVTVTYTEGNVKVRADISNGEETGYEEYTQSGITGTIYPWLTVEKSHLENLVYSKQDIGSTQLYERGTTNAWTSGDLDSWSKSDTDNLISLATDGDVKGIQIAIPKGTPNDASITKDFNASANATITYVIEWKYGGVMSGGSANYEYVKFGSLVLAWGSYKASGYNNYRRFISTDGGNTYTELMSGTNNSFTDTITLTVDTATNILQSITTSNFGTLTTYIGQSVTEADEFTFGYKRNGSQSAAQTTTLLSISVTETVPETIPVLYNVYAKASGTRVGTLATGSAGDGAPIDVYVPKVFKAGDNYYVLNDSSSYKRSFTQDADDPNFDVEYTLDSEIVAFLEVGTGTNEAYSSGSNWATNENITYNAQPGIYQAEIPIISKGGSGSNHRQEGIYLDGTEMDSTTDNTNGVKTLTAKVPEAGTLVVRGKGSSNYTDNIDYIILRRTGDYNVEPVTEDAECVATSADSDEEYSGAVYRAMLSSGETTYTKVSATVTPAVTTGKTAKTTSKLTGGGYTGNIVIAIQVEGLKASEIENVSVTLR